MQRRDFVKMLLGLPLLAAVSRAQVRSQGALLLEAPVAGFQYYEGARLWPLLNPGDPLTLVREPANPYDDKAVVVYWKGDKLGYLPRSDNTVIANLMDQGRQLKSSITRTRQSGSPWERLYIKVSLITHEDH